jgi:hypothetical protein
MRHPEPIPLLEGSYEPKMTRPPATQTVEAEDHAALADEIERSRHSGVD